MLNDLGKNYTVEDCQRVSVCQLDLTKALFIDLGLQRVELTETPCYYGGLRVWFLCPACCLRVGTLYRKPLSDEFYCRHCNKLMYQLQLYHRSNVEYLLKAIHAAKIKGVRENKRSLLTAG
ncbi:MAG TPA: hypothetical protein VFA93_01000 [Patescibacteria group bacterium]|nr:hypothetical protein [Patescibacteria group bacterium]